MKILILGTEARYRAYQPDMPFIGRQELVFLDKDREIYEDVLKNTR